jgi:hypothetical protein
VYTTQSGLGIITIIQDGETIMDVECGTNKAKLTLEKLWQGSKGQCVDFQGSWLTPNEFQYVSGRETAKDWKRLYTSTNILQAFNRRQRIDYQ